MKNSNELPRLKVVLNSQKHENYRQIMDGKKPLHYYEDVRGFYYAVGYTDDMARANVLPDEFVWN